MLNTPKLCCHTCNHSYVLKLHVVCAAHICKVSRIQDVDATHSSGYPMGPILPVPTKADRILTWRASHHGKIYALAQGHWRVVLPYRHRCLLCKGSFPNPWSFVPHHTSNHSDLS